MTIRMTFQMIQKRMISLLNCFAPPMRQRFASRLMMAATKAGPAMYKIKVPVLQKRYLTYEETAAEVNQVWSEILHSKR